MLTQQAASRIITQGLDFPPFAISPKVEPPGRGRTQADFTFTISWEGETRDFAVEYKSQAGIANLQGAIARANALAYANTGLLPMVVMPYFRPEALDELVRSRTSGLDLCGNGVLYVPGNWFAYRTGQPNKFPDNAPIISPFRGNQSIVARAFLTRSAFDSQKQLVTYLSEYDIRASTVSKMLAALEQKLLVAKKPEIRVVRPDVLLDRLRDDYIPPTNRRSERIRLAESDSAWTRMNKNGVRYAISNPERYTVLPRSSAVLRVFTNDIDALLAGLEYSPDDRFPTLELIETESRVPFFDKQFADERWWTSPIQEYLALANGGKREADAAVAIRKQILQQDNPA